MDPEFGPNLWALVDLLDDEVIEREPFMRFLRAEALRELGQFTGALRCLDVPWPRAWLSSVKHVRRLARHADDRVRVAGATERRY